MPDIYGNNLATQQPSSASGWNTQTQNYGTPNTLTQQPVAQAAAQTGTSSLFQPAYLGAPATVNPSTISTGQFSPQATIEQLLTGFAPQEQTGQNQLTQMLANFGIGGGQAVGAENQFQGQEAAGLAPSIASAIQNSQGNTLAADTTNVNSTNQAADLNATDVNATNAANVATQNTAQQQELNDILQQWYAEFAAANGINTSGQGASNQNAVNYGQDITVTPNPFQSIFGDILGAGSTAAQIITAGKS